ncbi:MAG: DUF308 domain-containing protein [Bacteroidales bacterium]|jgi:uncharacterized membrane protein HdeD (DUF308 family)|nr:DUF308 domain-containing protein [Bacteroidales bacterium]MCI1784602.1 DUF308 domain-containing protein [Bacteroidales bacterium]
MITLGYKSRFSSILRACSAIAIGLVMLISNNATVMVVKIIAAFLTAAGIVSLIYGIVHRKEGALHLMSSNAIVDIVIGLLLFFIPGAIANIIVYLIGIVLIIFGALQIVVLASSMALIGMGFLSFLLPIIAVIGGIILLFNPFGMKVMGIIAGICLIIYGVSELLSIFRVDKAKAEFEIRSAPVNHEGPNNQDGTDESGLEDAKEVDYKKEK